MAIIKDTGFLLRKIPFSESSLIIKAYTREHGLMSFMVKGAKRSTSRMRGLLEPVLHLQWLFPDFSRSELRPLNEVSLLADFPGIRRDPHKHGMAQVFGEILLRYPPSETDAAEFHDLLLASQHRIESFETEPESLIMSLCSFLLRYCRLSGYAPQFRHCVRCGAEVAGASIPFQVDQGGPVCSRCAREEPGAQLLRAGLVAWMEALQKEEPLPSLNRVEIWRAENFLLQYLGRHAGGEKSLKSLAVWHAIVDGS